MNPPIIIIENQIHEAWKNAVLKLSDNQWEIWNLIVQINNPFPINEDFYKSLTKFSKIEKIKSPKQVAYTIFPSSIESINNDNDG